MVEKRPPIRYNGSGDRMELILETPRLRLRPYAIGDLEDYCGYILDPELRLLLGLPEVTDRQRAEETFRWLLDHREFLALEKKETGKSVGHICVHPPHASLRRDPALRGKWGCSVSFAVAKPERRQGLMEEALRRLIPELFRSVDYIGCEALAENGASRTLQEKLGFTLRGREPLGDTELFVHALENPAGKRALRMEKITPENWRLGLKVAPEQEHFVSDAAALLARAYAYRNSRSRAFVMYAGEAPVGMTLYYDEPELYSYVFSQLFIDRRYQGRGYGLAAARQLLERMERDGRFDRVVLCYMAGNETARQLYETLGFTHTGQEDEGEIIMEKLFRKRENK